jgi:hypothetical protein
MRNSFLSGESIGELPDPGNATDIRSADSPYETRLQLSPHKKTVPTRPDRSRCLPWEDYSGQSPRPIEIAQTPTARRAP